MQSEPLADNLASTSALETEPGRDITVTSSRAVQASRSPELQPTEVLGREDVDLSSKPPQPLDIPPTQEDVTIDRRGNSRPRSVKELADVFDRRQSHFAGIRQDNSFKRMEINYRLNNLEAESQRLQDCLEDIRSINANSKSSKTIKRPKARLKRLQEEMFLDIQAFTRSCQELQVLSTDLRDHERKLEASEGAFDNVCQAVIRKLRVLGHEFINDSADDLSLKSTSYFQSSSSAATASPPVEELATYFAAFSRLRNMSERLDDLLTEQHDQQEQRDLWADREIMSDESEEAFLRRWENSIAPARNDYEEAYVALDNARRACDDANIQIPEWAKADLNTEAEAKATTEVITNYGLSSNTTLVPVVRSLSDALENISVASSEQVAQVQALPGSSLPSGDLATTDRVVDWMEDIDSLNPDSLEDAVVSPPPKSSGALEVPEIGHQHGRSTSLTKSRSDGELQGGRETALTHQRHASSGDVCQKVRGRDTISAPYTPLEYCSHEYDQQDETLLHLPDPHLYPDRLHPWSYY